jgi:hypothetical protein
MISMSEKLPAIVPPPHLPEESQPVSSIDRRFACPRCGSEDQGAGYLVDYGDHFRHIYLAPRRLRIGRLRNLLRPHRHLTKVLADVCRNCGMVILEVNTDEFEAAERRFGRS